jgi:hypothetical protein
MVVDVSQPARPLQVSDWRVDTLLHKLAVSTEYAVVSQVDGKLHFFLLEKGYYPVHTGELMLGQGFPDVALQNSYLYAATGGFEASGFYVIEVGSAKPIIGTLTLPPTALRTRVAGNYAYVAGRRNLGFTIDIRNPAQPRLVGDWPVIGIPSSMWMIGNTLYLIDEASDIIQVLDISNPLQPIVYDWALTQGGGHTYGAVSDGFAYIVSAAAGFLRIFRLPQIGT